MILRPRKARMDGLAGWAMENLRPRARWFSRPSPTPGRSTTCSSAYRLGEGRTPAEGDGDRRDAGQDRRPRRRRPGAPVVGEPGPRGVGAAGGSEATGRGDVRVCAGSATIARRRPAIFGRDKLEKRDGREYARKFELLLDLFPFPDGADSPRTTQRRWKASELEVATHRQLSASYLSALRKGKIGQPGREHLRLIALVLGFPEELWYLDPEEWQEELRGHERAGLRAEEFAGGEYLGELLGRRMGEPGRLTANTRVDTRTGRPLNTSYAEVASRSGGRLTEEEVLRIRKGGIDRPTLTQILGLSAAFGVPVSEWIDPFDFGREPQRRRDEGEDADVIDPTEIRRLSLDQEVQDLDAEELAFLISTAKQLKAMRARQDPRAGS